MSICVCVGACASMYVCMCLRARTYEIRHNTSHSYNYSERRHITQSTIQNLFRNVYFNSSDYTLRLLIKAGELSNKKTYPDVMKAAFGKFGLSAVLVKQFLYPFISK